MLKYIGLQKKIELRSVKIIEVKNLIKDDQSKKFERNQS